MNNYLRMLMAGVSPMAMMLREGADGGGGGGGDAGAADASMGGDAAKTPESVLFPNEKPAGETKASADPAGTAKADDTKPGDDWKEYVPDATKSQEENARLKAEHDKTKPAEKKDDAADKVPDDGKYVLKMPEGVEVDQALLDAIGPEFKAANLTKAQAQKVADAFIKVQQERATKYGETPAGQQAMAMHGYNAEYGQPDTWSEMAATDKEIGGTKWDASRKAAVRAVNTFGTPELKKYLNASGGGNHPELIRFMAKAGELIKEDQPAGGGLGGQGKPADASHILFPNDVPKG